jgi:hypothetical protein
LEEHEFIPGEDVFIEEYQKISYETSSELSDEADGISILDGYISDESTQKEDVRSYDDLFQSTNVVGPTYITMYDEDIPSVIEVLQYEDSTKYLIYDGDDEGGVTVPRHDDEIKQRPLALQGLEEQLLVKEKCIVQVLIR